MVIWDITGYCSSHRGQLDADLGEDAGKAATRNIIGCQTGYFLALKGKLEVLFGHGDFFAGGRDSGNIGYRQGQVMRVGSGDFHCTCDLLTLLSHVVDVEGPVWKGILNGTLNGEKLLFADGLGNWTCEHEVIRKVGGGLFKVSRL